MINNKIKIGIVGLGHLGKFHVEQTLLIPEFDLVGVYDIDSKISKKINKQHNVQNYNSLESLIQKTDCLSIVTPTENHYEVAKQALEYKNHVFIEKPITSELSDAQELLDIAKKNNLLIQVGHIERFNPVYLKLKEYNFKPQFIESHRLTQFNPRALDVPVISDLMIHDLDIILSIVQSEVKNIIASGVKVVTDLIDLANARIEFENGTVANVTASRISNKQLRKLRLFAQNEYITVDFLLKQIEKYKLQNKQPDKDSISQLIDISPDNKKYILYNKPEIKSSNALNDELTHFAHSIINQSNPLVDGQAGLNALSLAKKIEEKLLENESKS